MAVNSTIEPTKTGRLEAGAHSIWWEVSRQRKKGSYLSAERTCDAYQSLVRIFAIAPG